jgi:putative heme-binding domain-containing protein
MVDRQENPRRNRLMPSHARRPARLHPLALALHSGLLVGPLAVAAAGEPGPWLQPAERMPLATDPKDAASTAPNPALAPWIWGPDEKREYRLTKAFQGGAKTAVLVATCDNAMKLSVNGTEVAASDTWEAPVAIDVTNRIIAGDNELVAVVKNAGGLAGFSCRLVLTDPDGGVRVVESDQSWSAFDTLAPPNPVALRVVAGPGNGPWGDVLSAPRKVAVAPFTVPPGFEVERLFVVPKEELGSWVCLATDPKGRLIASDQGDKGLVRITPAPLAGSGETVVEKIPVPLTGAQGLLWAFDALYVVCNGGPGSGLYRVTDTDADDTLDTVEKLRSFAGGGEHGPHNILLSPDGTRLFVICGNHTQVPFTMKNLTEPQTMGGIRSTQRRVELPADGTSRVPPNWDEDQIMPRMWDANGHAAGILAPGGYVASTDRDGKAWEIWTAGYRNPYDFAFNADGEMFVYDADMEWDFGTPWYRPTRVNHATSGSDLGWRSGSGKWQPSFPDSLPALVTIGPGSPVGVAFGYGTKFPAKYQRALYICDWTFGTMYAIHLEPSGSTYTGVKEEFISRTPLPLTDMTIGRDGAMYFAVGGRGGQSELYRVSYAGEESTTASDARDTANAAERATRRDLEALHHRADDPAAAVAKALPHLAHPDRFVRTAARVALEHQPLEIWQAQALAGPEPRGIIAGAIAVAHQADQAAGPAVLAALDRIDPGALDVAGRIDLARAYELAIVRLGEPAADAKARIATRLGALFPSGDFDLDRELSSLLVGVRAPGIVTKLTGLLAAPTPSAGSTNLAPNEADLERLLSRNAGYGRAVQGSLEKRADLLQIHYAYALRTVGEKDAWTAADRKAYYEWFGRAREWAGGNSFRKFLTNIETESLAHLSDTEKMALETLGVRQPYAPPPLPKPEGPGRPWTVDEVLALAAQTGADGLTQGRDFEHGKRTFAAARCVVCHRFGEDGGATGPDLTQAAGRFQLKDVVEAIVHPSRVISDQYKASIVQTADGKVVSGRIVNESPEKITIVTDPENATKFVEVARSDVEEILPATESLMPKGLLDQLNDREVLDLLAYVLSRDKPGSGPFKRK